LRRILGINEVKRKYYLLQIGENDETEFNDTMV